MEPAKVFISYSHDSPEHMQRVLDLANALRGLGVDANIDRYYQNPPQGWPRWCEEQLRPEAADFVLVVCTKTYLARVQGKVAADEGRGVYWEGAIIYNYIYTEKLNGRFLPVLLDDEPDDSIPIPLFGRGPYRLRGLALADAGFEALYRLLTGQPAVTKPPLGAVHEFTREFLPGPRVERETLVAAPLPARAAISSFAPASAFDIDRIYNYAPAQLIGREKETEVIEQAWSGGAARVLAFVALGGEGKTSLVASWANGLAAKNWAGCEAAFAWSFYRQGSSEQAGASSDLFFAEALKFFGLDIIERESGYEKGKRLARHLGDKRALLILDGLEPLQYPPGSPMSGRLKDDALSALLKALANRNAGLCLVATRYLIEDLKGFARTVSQYDLGGLSAEAGAALLTTLGVKGAERDTRQLVADVEGHPLTLEIVGTYLKKAHGGDVARRDRIRLETADRAKGGHAMRAMQEYADWLETAGAEGARALALLRLTGLFDRPASATCLEALWSAPAIPGLSEPLVDASEDERNLALSDLDAGKLLTVKRDGAVLIEVDAHPLLRAYFAKELREQRAEAGREAHRRLYVHLTTTTKDKEQPTLDDLQPLYQAVAHGCAAGLWKEALAVYRDRICRGHEFYSTFKLGAFGADLGAAACFFEAPWRTVSPHLSPADQAWLRNVAGFDLRALGRLGEASEPMRAGLEGDVARKDWKNSARAASNLSELELTLGEIEAAVRYGETAVAHAESSGDAFQRVVAPATEADARHQLGARAEAEALFVAAEAMQAKGWPTAPKLFSLRGFQYCDLMLAPAEQAAWRRLMRAETAAPRDNATPDAAFSLCAEAAARATQALAIPERISRPLDSGHDHLTLARAALYAAALRDEPPPGEHIAEAIDLVRRAGAQEFIPRPLLTRALHRALTSDFAGAQEDLDEAYEIAERGPMKLHLADIHLHRARLFGLIANHPPRYPWESPQADLAAARALIDGCGYGRRRPELEDAEAAWQARGGS